MTDDHFFDDEKREARQQGLKNSIYIKIVSSWCMFFALQYCFNWFFWPFGHLGRATCTVHLIHNQTNQGGIECTKAKK